MKVGPLALHGGPMLKITALLAAAALLVACEREPKETAAAPADTGSGEVRLPSTFPATGVRFFYGPTGGYSSSFQPDVYAASWGITKTLYVDLAEGSDATGDGSSGAPYRTARKAFVAATTAAETAIEIRVVTGGADVLFSREPTSDTEFYPATPIAIVGKRIYVTPDSPAHKLFVTTAQGGLSWSLAAGQTYTYQATRSNVSKVV